MKFVEPRVYLVGYTTANETGILDYLAESGQNDFWATWNSCTLSPAEKLCSLFAKLCYKSLVLGRNDNISRVRDIPDNLVSTINAAHGSIFEHVQLNFIITNCSRVFTHELVRHRVGTAFSQTSGRYVRGDSIDFVFDPILEPVRERIERVLGELEYQYNLMVDEMGLNNPKLDFGTKKQITSALRRILPNGQSNEIAFSCNLRSVRHLIQVRTSRHAEWEIRRIFNQVYNIVQEKYPLMFHGSRVEMVNGYKEVTGMRLQPYEKESSL